jgi:dTDP-4-amino-4,6-dideoxygalactose transaminase
LTVPSIEDDDLQAVRDVLETGYLVQGSTVLEFEHLVASYVGTEHAIAVSNCTAALHLALLALGIGPGDRVAVTTYSWPATANVIALCGADPVFVDIDAATYNMDPSLLAATLESEPVQAILPVHTFGGLADMPEILDVASRYGVPVIEDAACALGAEFEGRRAGAWGVMGCFSFHPRKAITTGEGGIITLNDAELARLLRALRNHGLDPDSATPKFIVPGFNYRLTEFQAAMGITQMRKLERIVAARRSRAAIYNRLLDGTPITTPEWPAGGQHVYQTYVVLLPREVAGRRHEIIDVLREQGIETTVGTYHMPSIAYFQEHADESDGYPVTDDVAARSLSLPLHEKLTMEEQEFVVNALIQQVGHRA